MTQEQINKFLDYLKRIKNRSDKTVANYKFYLERFSDWFNSSSVKKLEKIKEKQIVEYKEWLKKRKPRLSKETRNYHLIALRNMLKYLARNGTNCLYYNKIKLFKTKKKPIEIVEMSELARFLESPLEVDSSKVIKARDKAVLEVLICTGLKVSELARLEIKGFLPKSGSLVGHSKLGKRKFALSNQAIHWVKEYLSARNDSLPYLFISHDKGTSSRTINKKQKGLSPRSLERIVKKYQQAAGISKTITPNLLRHYYAKRLIMKGEHIDLIKQKLGNVADNSIEQYK
ncbi:tyrosine-type recombinase/integrase [Candidatus Falkowbacteria bacterium]|jgi:site-specific recombinase XerD|nr:tyrosine-type recombinase/integrase [Candidatus Falkowbacteria bacterium]MBT7007776.1 tyrosine-type recombinase/integrase [Candidatus Falkowbacteria bacterium]